MFVKKRTSILFVAKSEAGLNDGLCRAHVEVVNAANRIPHNLSATIVASRNPLEKRHAVGLLLPEPLYPR
ncbi:hypothetical protein, partial [Candidatus Thiosymbion oneisti]|uniref:hypothetical protein n=1 Tax=Candidatus Thiosymbion oneisti TaxID=589554 RepID=UPI001A9C8F0F